MPQRSIILVYFFFRYHDKIQGKFLYFRNLSLTDSSFNGFYGFRLNLYKQIARYVTYIFPLRIFASSTTEGGKKGNLGLPPSLKAVLNALIFSNKHRIVVQHKVLKELYHNKCNVYQNKCNVLLDLQTGTPQS